MLSVATLILRSQYVESLCKVEKEPKCRGKRTTFHKCTHYYFNTRGNNPDLNYNKTIGPVSLSLCARDCTSACVCLSMFINKFPPPDITFFPSPSLLHAPAKPVSLGKRGGGTEPHCSYGPPRAVRGSFPPRSTTA